RRNRAYLFWIPDGSFSISQGVEVMRLRAIGALVLALLLAAVGTATAQERFGIITGVIEDAQSSPVPGATVTATNTATKSTRVAVTGSDGAYRIPDLDPGRYSVTVELSGFQKAEATDVVLLLGRTFTFSPKLQVGALSETVNVTGEVKQIDLGSTTVA